MVFGTAALFVLAYWWVLAHLNVSKDVRSGLVVLTFLPALTGAYLGSVPAKRAEQVFPPCEFDFGAERRRRSGHRSVLWALVSVLFVPIILGLFFGWLFSR
ncbi:putative membrane protein YfcA [Sphingomonas sp. F9_3S_D5_B_2]